MSNKNEVIALVKIFISNFYAMRKALYLLLSFSSFVFLLSCGNETSNSSTDIQSYTPPPPTRMDGVEYFYNNYDEFELCLGDGYGCHRIKAVRLNGDYLEIDYAYKNGELSGTIEPNGSYSGRYETYSTSGKFDLRFGTDGTAYGSWHSTSSMIGFSGSLSIE